jgi:hypothetical protein
LNVSFALLGQFDLSGDDLNSQYAAGRISLPLYNIALNVGACLKLIQDRGDLAVALAAEAGIAWLLPTRLPNRVSFLGRFSSGVIEDSPITAFLPISSKPQGQILRARLSGISMLSLDYIARPHNTFALGFSSSYFVRSDLGTYKAYPLSDDNNSGFFLGNEFFAYLLWSPVSDLHLNLGGGAFLPSMGNAARNADMIWRIELNLILSLR